MSSSPVFSTSSVAPNTSAQPQETPATVSATASYSYAMQSRSKYLLGQLYERNGRAMGVGAAEARLMAIDQYVAAANHNRPKAHSGRRYPEASAIRLNAAESRSPIRPRSAEVDWMDHCEFQIVVLDGVLRESLAMPWTIAARTVDLAERN